MPNETIGSIGCGLGARLDRAIRGLEELVDWPTKNYGRRTEDGYPSEIIYDQFSYERIVDTYRDSIRNILYNLKKPTV